MYVYVYVRGVYMYARVREKKKNSICGRMFKIFVLAVGFTLFRYTFFHIYSLLFANIT